MYEVEFEYGEYFVRAFARDIYKDEHTRAITIDNLGIMVFDGSDKHILPVGELADDLESEAVEVFARWYEQR